MYLPPFTVSAEAINLIAEISGQIERYAIRLEQEDGLRLRKANRIKTIHSSLAIEGNTLSEDEVRDIIDGQFGIKFGEEFGIKYGIKFGINDKQLLLLIDSNPTITASDAAERMEISLRGAEKIFKKLRDSGVISRQGSKKSGSWIINK